MTTPQQAIGGYFELELPRYGSYHSDALALNTGRNSLEYILRARGYSRVYLPYYCCDVLLEPFEKLGTDYSFYHIDDLLEMASDVTLNDSEALLYINYFGLKQDYVKTLATRYGKQLIVDNTQAFFALPAEGVDTFYSCRKFFGVADGAYLYCNKPLDCDLPLDKSWDRMTHLLLRIDESPEVGYSKFQSQDERLKFNDIRMMSPLTRRIMASVNYHEAAERRRSNFRQLHEALGSRNGISLLLDDDAVPMVYPYLTDDLALRQRLIDSKVFVARYWPNVLEWCNHDTREYKLTMQLLPLPIDQRYGTQEMDRIIKLI